MPFGLRGAVGYPCRAVSFVPILSRKTASKDVALRSGPTRLFHRRFRVGTLRWRAASRVTFLIAPLFRMASGEPVSSCLFFFFFVFTLSRKTASQVVALRSGPPVLADGGLSASLEACAPSRRALVRLLSSCLFASLLFCLGRQVAGCSYAVGTTFPLVPSLP